MSRVPSPRKPVYGAFLARRREAYSAERADFRTAWWYVVVWGRAHAPVPRRREPDADECGAPRRGAGAPRHTTVPIPRGGARDAAARPPLLDGGRRARRRATGSRRRWRGCTPRARSAPARSATPTPSSRPSRRCRATSSTRSSSRPCRRGLSRWIRQDIPHRLARRTELPVCHVVAHVKALEESR